MREENKFVLRHEWERGNGKIYERINADDRKHTEALGDLKAKVEKQTTLQQQTYDAQKETNESIKDLTRVMTGFGTEMTEMKYTVKSHDEKINMIQGTIDEKQKGNVQVLVAVIAAGGSVLAAAFGLAQHFF
ncbi:hypothetical protein [uncultured Staphylococcus sp.]|uniref:hypothetical protein n=1 Tax=uncultured Staphylococcus sp. TaxID=189668 RepID=UPI0025D1B8B1|nr:hypothetical protein [uncultured Staphylococcus sp.]